MDDKKILFLLVEDDDDHAALVIRTLSRESDRNLINRVADGEQALKYLRNEGEYSSSPKPDVVLLDLNMPKVDGLQVLKAAKQDVDLKTIPIVVMTTSDAETDRAKAYEFNANSYLVKPVDFNKFKKMVSDLSNYWGVWNEKAPTD